MIHTQFLGILHMQFFFSCVSFFLTTFLCTGAGPTQYTVWLICYGTWDAFSSIFFSDLGVPAVSLSLCSLLLSLWHFLPFLKYVFPEVLPVGLPEGLNYALRRVCQIWLELAVYSTWQLQPFLTEAAHVAPTAQMLVLTPNTVFQHVVFCKNSNHVGKRLGHTEVKLARQ